MTRAEFSKATKLAAWQACGGRCQSCTAKLFTGNIEYHHDQECTFGGTAALQNCVVLCRTCHSIITRKQASVIAKSNRVRARHLGLRSRRRSFATNRDGPFKQRMDGTVERR